MRIRNVQPRIARYLLQKSLSNTCSTICGEEERIRKHPPGVWQLGPAYVACGQRQQSFRGKQLGQGSSKPLRRNRGDAVIQRKLLIAGVTFIAGKEFVAAIACQQDFDSVLPRQASAVVGADCRRVRKWLVEVIDDPRNSVRGIGGLQAFH